MSKRIDMTNETYGWLRVLGPSDIRTKSGEMKWKCQCRCGNITYVTRNNLKNGSTTSCGCFHKKQLADRQKEGHQNTYDLSGEFGKGYTSKGEEFWFDLEDYDKIKNRTWCFNNSGYLISSPLRSEKNCSTFLFHRVVMEPIPDGMFVDHKDSLGPTALKFDNRKSNLRTCSNSENNMNTQVRKNNKLKTTGVYLNKTSGNWYAQITKNNKCYHLGTFKSFEEAVKAREKAEKDFFGEYAYDKDLDREAKISEV